MSVSDITNRDPVTLSPTDTVGKAAGLLVEHHVLALPVVDASGKLLGTFGIGDLARVLLPLSVTRAQWLEGLGDLDFIADSLEQLRERMERVQDDPVRKHLDRDRRYPLDPDSSFTEVLFLLHRDGQDVPVLERKTGRLMGMISPWDVVAKLG